MENKLSNTTMVLGVIIMFTALYNTHIWWQTLLVGLIVAIIGVIFYKKDKCETNDEVDNNIKKEEQENENKNNEGGLESPE